MDWRRILHPGLHLARPQMPHRARDPEAAGTGALRLRRRRLHESRRQDRRPQRPRLCRRISPREQAARRRAQSGGCCPLRGIDHDRAGPARQDRAADACNHCDGQPRTPRVGRRRLSARTTRRAPSRDAGEHGCDAGQAGRGPHRRMFRWGQREEVAPHVQRQFARASRVRRAQVRAVGSRSFSISTV